MKLTVVPWIIWALIVIAVIWATKAYAANLSYTWPDGNKLTLLSEPCQLGPWFSNWKRAVYLWGGQTVEACWTGQNAPPPLGPTVYTIDAQGEIGSISVGLFRKDEPV